MNITTTSKVKFRKKISDGLFGEKKKKGIMFWDFSELMKTLSLRTSKIG